MTITRGAYRSRKFIPRVSNRIAKALIEGGRKGPAIEELAHELGKALRIVVLQECDEQRRLTIHHIVKDVVSRRGRAARLRRIKAVVQPRGGVGNSNRVS